MKPANSVARRWLLAARLMRWANVLLTLVAAAAVSAAVRQLNAVSHRAGTSASVPGGQSPVLPATRPALVERIAAHPIRQPLVPKVELVAIPAAAAPTSAPVSGSGALAVEVVATYTGGDAQPHAFVRRMGAPNLLIWSTGSTEGGYRVKDIGDGWVVLESDQARHTLRVQRRGQ